METLNAKNNKTKMNLKYGILFVLLLGFSLLSCDKCDDSDCFGGVFVIFHPIDLNGNSLLNQPDSIYSLKSITLLPDTSGLRLSQVSNKASVGFSNTSISEFIIDWSSNKIDTFKVKLASSRTSNDCCDAIRLISLSNQDSTICDPCPSYLDIGDIVVP